MGNVLKVRRVVSDDTALVLITSKYYLAEVIGEKVKFQVDYILCMQHAIPYVPRYPPNLLFIVPITTL